MNQATAEIHELNEADWKYKENFTLFLTQNPYLYLCCGINFVGKCWDMKSRLNVCHIICNQTMIGKICQIPTVS